MRMRRKPGRRERVLNNYPGLIFNCSGEDDFSEKISTIANNIALPVCLEIGCGKGQFIAQMALKEPKTLFIGVELEVEVLYYTAEKVKQAACDNVILLAIDAAKLSEFLPQQCVKNMYLNFSDPWPKARHSKRRLTATSFLDAYKKILIKEGCLVQKTDNRALFEFSLQQFATNKWELLDVCWDYKSEENFDNDVMTEYEQRFRSLGQSIMRLIAKPC